MKKNPKKQTRRLMPTKAWHAFMEKWEKDGFRIRCKCFDERMYNMVVELLTYFLPVSEEGKGEILIRIDGWKLKDAIIRGLGERQDDSLKS